MSSRYSNSPTLVVTVRRSELGRVLHALLCLACAGALWLLAARGQLAWAAALAPPTVGLLWYQGRDRASGLQLHCRNATWTLVRGPVRREVTLQPGLACLPWGLQLRWRETRTGQCGGLWLFKDSAVPAELRVLRRRLILQR